MKGGARERRKVSAVRYILALDPRGYVAGIADGSLHEGGALGAFWQRRGRLYSISGISASMRPVINMGPYQHENRESVAEGYMTTHLKRLDSHSYPVGWSRQSWILWSHQERGRGENQGRWVSALGVHKMSASFRFYEKVIIIAQQIAISWVRAISCPSS